MRKAMYMIFCVMILSFVFIMPSYAENTTQGNYPGVRIDPATGEPYDFGGQTVYIYDWWSTGERVADPDERLAATYAYRDWLEETYNVKIVETALSSWDGVSSELTSRVMNMDNSELCLYAIAPDFSGGVISSNLVMPWEIDLSGEKWNGTVSDFSTVKGQTYGVSTGANEPNNCIFFNKRVLEEAGIDWDDIYDMQANGTWTWDAMSAIMAQVQRDTDNDGVIDIYGMTGSGDVYMQGLVFSNDAAFFNNIDGQLMPTMGSDAALEAIQYRVDTWDEYAAPTPEGANWDWYKGYWKQGTTAFYIGQAYQGFNDGSEMADMTDEWGCVMFPMGPNATDYVSYSNANMYVIPNVYDDETSWMLQQIYDLYTYDVNPGGDESWVGNKLLYTDERAVFETYAMMRDDEHTRDNKTQLLGSANDVLGGNLMWALGMGTPSEIIEAGMPAWTDLCTAFNSDCYHENIVWTVTSNPACIRNGQETGVCADCGVVFYRTIYAVGHDSGEWVTVKEATEDGLGRRQLRCTRCEAVLDTETYQYDPNGCRHENAICNVITEPTCIRSGKEEKICLDCGEKIIYRIDALKHVPGEWIVIKEPTEIAAGKKLLRCTVCDLIIELQRIPPTGEEYEQDDDIPDTREDLFAVRIDPVTGEPYDFGGQTVYIYDWWSTGERVADPDERLAATYEYRDWLEETYNVKIVETALSSWEGVSSELWSRVENSDNSELCLFAIAPEFSGGVISNNLVMPWEIDLSGEKWNGTVSDFSTVKGQTYGVSTGANEPNNCIFFNKRVLEEAGIDWDDIYDMQANGTWTWDAMSAIMAQVQRDTDNDGVIDIYGMTGSGDVYTQGLVFSNDAAFFNNIDGQLMPTMGSDAALEAIQYRMDTWDEYAAPTPEGANWDWYKGYWKQGTTAFYIGQAYQGFNDGSEMADMTDEWGCVMFPMGPNATDYVSYSNANMYVIPNVYDDETSWMLQQIYDLYTYDVNAEEDESWVGNKLLYTDERAVYETYAMMRDDEYARVNMMQLLGSANDVLGGSLMWALGMGTPSEIIEAGMPAWTDLCDVFNEETTVSVLAEGDWGELNWILDVNGRLAISGSGRMDGFDYTNTEAWRRYKDQIKSVVIENGVLSIGENAFGECNNLRGIVIPDSVSRIDKHAFGNCGKLTSIKIPGNVSVIGEEAFYCCTGLYDVNIPKNVERIGKLAFGGCDGLTKITIPSGEVFMDEMVFWDCTNLVVTVYWGSAAENYCLENNVPCNVLGVKSLILASSGTDGKIEMYGETGARFISSNAVLYLPSELSTIGSEAFSSISACQVVIPSGCTTIGSMAFSGCNGLMVVVVPSTVTSISADAFNGCGNVIIYCEGGSYAYRYAESNHFLSFVPD